MLLRTHNRPTVSQFVKHATPSNINNQVLATQNELGEPHANLDEDHIDYPLSFMILNCCLYAKLHHRLSTYLYQ